MKGFLALALVAITTAALMRMEDVAPWRGEVRALIRNDHVKVGVAVTREASKCPIFNVSCWISGLIFPVLERPRHEQIHWH